MPAVAALFDLRELVLPEMGFGFAEAAEGPLGIDEDVDKGAPSGGPDGGAFATDDLGLRMGQRGQPGLDLFDKCHKMKRAGREGPPVLDSRVARGGRKFGSLRGKCMKGQGR